ncbi:TPA: AAA family ATPase [Candidatus Woesearchaeota archaeon]|nr:AAA family ATPase [Candidatus Woesearchaeota archaeon]
MPPRLVADKHEIKRIRTYINGLDENVQGGIPEGHITLISGAAGTMKSSITFNVLYHEAVNGSNGLYISLEQSAESLLNHMTNMDYDFSKINLVVVKDLAELSAKMQVINRSKGSIFIVDVGCVRKEIRDIQTDNNKSWLNVIKNVIKKVSVESNTRVFVLDSLSALYVLSRFENPRIELFMIFEFLRDMNITSFLISEMPLDGSKFSEYEIEDFLADAIIVLKLTPFRRQVVREISVVKMRTTACNNDIFSLEFKNGQFYALYGGQNPLL